MHRIQEVYKCVCAKCGKDWITKEKKLPERCAKCNSKGWDSDWTGSEEESATERAFRTEPVPEHVEHKFTDVAMNPAMDMFLAKVAAKGGQVQSDFVEEAVDPWAFKDIAYDDQRNEYYAIEKHVLGRQAPRASKDPKYRDDIERVKKERGIFD